MRKCTKKRPPCHSAQSGRFCSLLFFTVEHQRQQFRNIVLQRGVDDAQIDAAVIVDDAVAQALHGEPGNIGVNARVSVAELFGVF